MIALEELKKIVGKYSLKQPIFVVGRYGVEEVKGYNFCTYYNDFAESQQFQWTNNENDYRVVSLDMLYIDKKEAEHVYKYHAEKTIKFNPPTFKEACKPYRFLNSETDFKVKTITRFYSERRLTVYEIEFVWDDDYQDDFIELIDEDGDLLEKLHLSEENYYKILDLAKDMFEREV